MLLAIFDDLRVVDRHDYVTHYTPHMNALRASATTFLSAHAQTALCAPSRASFLSGRRPDLTRVHWTDRHLREWPRAREWITLPQHFRDHGYYTTSVGKVFHPGFPAAFEERTQRDVRRTSARVRVTTVQE